MSKNWSKSLPKVILKRLNLFLEVTVTKIEHDHIVFLLGHKHIF